MDSIRPKTKELLTYYGGFHGNLVTIATRYVADAYCPKEPPYQICSGNLRQGSRMHCLKKCCFLKDVNNSAYCSEIWPTN